MLKLHHLVDDKIHARSIGPVLARHPAAAGRQGAVRRPALRRNGGLGAGSLRRRLHLQEMLTVKSDDVAGRTKVYEAIVKGDDNFEAGIPNRSTFWSREVRGLSAERRNPDAEGAEKGPFRDAGREAWPSKTPDSSAILATAARLSGRVSDRLGFSPLSQSRFWARQIA